MSASAINNDRSRQQANNSFDDNMQDDDMRGMSVSESDSRTYTSFFHNDGKLGAASYNEETFELFAFNDTNESTSTFESMVAIIETVKPQSIVYGANNEDTIGKYLRRMFNVAADKEADRQQLPFSHGNVEQNANADEAASNTQMSNGMLCIPCDIQIPFDCRYKAELVTMSARDFSYSNSIERIRCIQFADVDCDALQNVTEEQRFSSLYTYVDFQSTCCVRAIGGLLRFLDRSRIGILPFEADDAGGGGGSDAGHAVRFQPTSGDKFKNNIHCVVRQILPLDVQDMVYVSTRTVDSLRIFHTEPGSSAYKRGLGWKDGLSLFRLCNRTVSHAGYQLLHLWFRRPIRNEAVLLNRHRAIEFFIRHRRADVTVYLLDRLRNIGTIRPILGRMAKGEPSARDWSEFYTTIFNALGICEMCSNAPAIYPHEISIFARLADFAGHSSLLQLLTSINNTIDLAQSRKNARFTMHSGVDAELDDIRRTFNNLTQLLDSEANGELDQLDARIASCAIMYMPQLGFMLQIAAVNITPEIDRAQAHRLTFVFENNGQRYYKSPRTEVLNVQYGDLKTNMNNREQFYQFKLQQLVIRNASQLAALVRLCAELDCLISLAQTAQNQNYVRPNFSRNGLLEIVKGRHPLQELCTREFVPNNLKSGGDVLADDDVSAEQERKSLYSRIKLLTGPNMSGKSVFMKQVALIVYMAHVGSFVPAEYAVIPFCDRILTQMRAVESTHIPLSAFGLDSMSVNVALRFATRDSLVLLDEFGRGTLVNDGEALLSAAVNHWIRAAQDENGRGCPHVIVSTHFSALHDMIIKPTSLVESLTFETRILSRNNATNSAAATSASMENLPLDLRLVQTHKLVKGRTEFNYALLVARNKANNDLFVRAKQIMYALEQRVPVIPFPMPRIQAYTALCEQLLNMLCELDLEAAKRGEKCPESAENDEQLFDAESDERERRIKHAIDACCQEMIKILQNSDAITLTTATTTIAMSIKVEEDDEFGQTGSNAGETVAKQLVDPRDFVDSASTVPSAASRADDAQTERTRYENVSDQPMRTVTGEYFMR